MMGYAPFGAERRFSPRGTTWCNTVVFDPSKAAIVIRECKDDHIPILGIEGFTLGTKDSKEVIYTSTADILDLSDDPEGYELALAFVSDSKRSGMYFDFVFGD
jgi:hypothetical protein